ncbi:PEP-utilizing enzyme, partial [Nocardia jejuensis]|uniref:PEP-utilizing enzyme n=1 Tax=Nocardia jejuensis TaxID=328049 RepID=UPI000AA0455B
PRTEPEDFVGMVHAAAVVTLEGGAGSHAAVVARELGRPAVVGAVFTDPAWPVGSGAELVTVCGTTGRVWLGAVPLAEGGATGWPGDLIGVPRETAVLGSIDELLLREPEVIRLTRVQDPARLPPSAIVVTDDPDVAATAARHVRVAFVCDGGPDETPWRTTLPDISLGYVIVAAPAQSRYAHAVLARRESTTHRSETPR